MIRSSTSQALSERGRVFVAISLMTCLAVCTSCALGSSTPRSPARAGLTYDAETQGPVPIPPSERALQTTVAEPWFKVSEEGRILEGAIFDPDGNLLFCDLTGRRVLRLTPNKHLSTFVSLDELAPGGLAFHRDGRLFIAALDFVNARGAIYAVNPDGSGLQAIVPPEAGYAPNDLVFNAEGGFYFTDFKGTPTEPTGGVYYVSPDFRTIERLLPNLAMANGVTLSPDGRVLWVTEFGRNLLHRIELAGATTIAPIGWTIAYSFIGPPPDSMRADADGNVCVAMYGQGRVLVFNRNGIPIGQALLSGREQGHNLRSTSLAIHPDRPDLYVVTNDGDGGQGATVFHARAFSRGQSPASSRR